MKSKIFLTTLLLLAGMSTSLVNAQRMTINLKDGNKQEFSLTTLQKISFSSNNLVLNYANTTFTSIAITDIRKITMVTGAAAVKSPQADESKISVFFNTSDDQINIKNAPEKTAKAYVYRMDGVLVLNTEVSSSNNLVNASSLANGLYLLKINNQVFKFKK